MPNKWTKATQAIYEFFYGPRTVDVEFNSKVEELNSIMNSMKTITSIIKNFPNQTMGLKNFCQSIYNHLTECYKGNSIYIPFITDVCDSHKKIEIAYLNLCENIIKIENGNLEWNKKFTEVQNSLNNREETRKVYDHYDEKMEKLVKDRNNKLSKGENEHIKDIEKFERNEVKYKKAASDFIQMSNYSYRIIQDLLDYRYKILNPIICNVVNEEKIFFDACSNFFSKFENISQKMEGLNKGFQKNPNNYDGAKYCRASILLQGLNTNSLTEIKNKEKYSYDNYHNKKENNNFNNNINNNNFQNSNNVNLNNNNDYYEESGYIIGGQSQRNNNDSKSINNVNNMINKNNTLIDNSHQYSYDDYIKKTKTLPKTSFNNDDNNDNNNTSIFNFNNNSNFVNNTTFNFGNNESKMGQNNSFLPKKKPINDFIFEMNNKNTYDFDQPPIYNPYGNIDLNNQNNMNYGNNLNFSSFNNNNNNNSNNNNNNNNINNNIFSQGNNNSNMNNFGSGFNF